MKNEVTKFSDCSELFLMEKAKASKVLELLCLVILSKMAGRGKRMYENITSSQEKS